MTNGEDESKPQYLRAGMTEVEYDAFGTVIGFRMALEDLGFEEMAGPLRTLTRLIDRWVDREAERARILSDGIEGYQP